MYTSKEYRPKLKQGLSPNCVEACSCAQATVLSLCNRCHTGQVSINELKIVVQNVDQILSLFQACTGIDENKNLVHMTKLKSTVNERKKEFSIFFQRQTVLKYLCRFINDEVKGIPYQICACSVLIMLLLLSLVQVLLN